MEQWFLVLWLYTGTPDTAATTGVASLGPFTEMQACLDVAYAIEHAGQEVGAGCSIGNTMTAPGSNVGYCMGAEGKFHVCTFNTH